MCQGIRVRAVILAGGKGSRLKPITDKTPKPMVSVKGKPFLEYLVDYLGHSGIKNIILLVGYLGAQIRGYFGDGSKWGAHIEYVHEKKPLGTAGALKNAEDKLPREFLLLNGDTYLPIDYGKVVEFFHKHDRLGVIIAYDNPNRIVPNNIAVGESNLVLAYSKKNSEGMNCVDAGGLVLKKEAINFIASGRICSLEQEILPRLIEMRELAAFHTDKKFYDVGTPRGLKEIEGVLG